jgi:hypothetical protein
MTNQLLPPQNWDVFEQLCHSLWKEMLSDPEAKMHGRRGQSQHGVDVYGHDHATGMRELVGIQCKGKDNYTNKNITETELRSEVKKAKGFRPNLNRFIIATTANRDANVQSFTRIVNVESTTNNGFSVSTWSWPDIADKVQDYPHILRKFYPEVFVNPNIYRTEGTLKFSIPLSFDHEQKIAALFEVDDLRGELNSDFRHEVRDFVLEVASNSFRHGHHATKLSIEITARTIEIRDNGQQYDQITAADDLVHDKKKQGLKYINYFKNQYASEIDVSYVYDSFESENVVKLIFSNPIATVRPDKCLISFSDFTFIGRAEASSAAEYQYLDEECRVYTVHLSRRDFMMSSLYPFLAGIVERLPEGKSLNVVIPNRNHKDLMDKWFDPSLVKIICG